MKRKIEELIVSRMLFGKIATAVAFVSLVLFGVMVGSRQSRASENTNSRSDEDKSLIGLRVAPVPLNLAGKDRHVVGLRSYLVNVQADCNGCHTLNKTTEYLGNPALFAPPSLTEHQLKQVNPATYLGGGQDFGPFPAPDSPLHIFTRNLTPDVSGKPVGGHSFSEFSQILKTGKDFDMIHPTCPADTPQTSGCVPYPFDGSLLQIMPWPAFQDLTDQDLWAIYEYLSSIPCIDTVVPGQPQLRNNCPMK